MAWGTYKVTYTNGHSEQFSGDLKVGDPWTTFSDGDGEVAIIRTHTVFRIDRAVPEN